jgi:hypothetical protein
MSFIVFAALFGGALATCSCTAELHFGPNGVWTRAELETSRGEFKNCSAICDGVCSLAATHSSEVTCGGAPFLLTFELGSVKNVCFDRFGESGTTIVTSLFVDANLTPYSAVPILKQLLQEISAAFPASATTRPCVKESYWRHFRLAWILLIVTLLAVWIMICLVMNWRFCKRRRAQQAAYFSHDDNV